MDEITAQQRLAANVRAGRGMLGWSQQDLADRAKLSRAVVARIELGVVDPRASTVKALELLFLSENIQLLDQEGYYGVIRMKGPPVIRRVTVVDE